MLKKVHNSSFIFKKIFINPSSLFTIIFFILHCSLITNRLFAQAPPELEWDKTFGGSSYDGALSLVQTADGGYALGGYTYSKGAGYSDFWLVKTDARGNKIWDKTFGGSNYDVANSLVQTADGGYALGGYTKSKGAGSGDFWLVKTDARGNKQWDKTFGGSEEDKAWSLVQTSDGGYALGGYTYSKGAGSRDFWLVKTDANGNKIWDKTFGRSDWDWANALVQTADGGYALGGYTLSKGAGGYDFWLVKTDARGNKQWDKTFGGSDWDWANALVQTADGGYALGGYTLSKGAGNYDFWLVKTDARGNKIWDKTFGGSDWDWANALVQTADGGYALGGYTLSKGAGSWDFWLVKTDARGNKIWDKTFGGSNSDWANSLVQTADGGYALGGYTWSKGAGKEDFWLVKAGELTIKDKIERDITMAYKNGKLSAKDAIQETLAAQLASYSQKKQSELNSWFKSEKTKLEVWSKKDEFETTDEYNQRILQLPSKENLLNYELKKRKTALEKDLKSHQKKQAKLIFQAYHQKQIDHVEWNSYNDLVYDADNETFRIKLIGLEAFNLRVPISVARSFKSSAAGKLLFKNPAFILTEAGWQLKTMDVYHKALQKNFSYDKSKEPNYVEPQDVVRDINIAGSTTLNTSHLSTHIELAEVIKSEETAGEERYNLRVNLPKSAAKPNAYAVVIGTRAYDNDGTAPVDYAINDARMVKKYLLSLGFEDRNIFYKENASRSDFIKFFGGKTTEGKLASFADKENEEVFIFISGHGTPAQNGEAYFFPKDGLINNLEETAYPHNWLMNNLTKMKAGKKTVVLDVCFSGKTGSAQVVEDMSALTLYSKVNINRAPNTLIISATASKQFASWHKSQAHGLLTYYFLEGLHNGNADTDKNTSISYAELHNYIFEKVKDEAEHLGRKQHPQLNGGGDKNSTFVKLK